MLLVILLKEVNPFLIVSVKFRADQISSKQSRHEQNCGQNLIWFIESLFHYSGKVVFLLWSLVFNLELAKTTSN